MLSAKKAGADCSMDFPKIDRAVVAWRIESLAEATQLAMNGTFGWPVMWPYRAIFDYVIDSRTGTTAAMVHDGHDEALRLNAAYWEAQP
jgi:hypothetical protein